MNEFMYRVQGPNESFQEYANVLTSLIFSLIWVVPMRELQSRLIRRFVNGLRDAAVSSLVSACNPQSLNAAVNMAMVFSLASEE